MSPSILEIPDLPMEMIINDLDYLSIQSVRKTCWDLRNFIDDQKPKIWMKTITIHEMNDEVIMSCNFPTLGLSGFIHLFYEKHENGCLIQGATSDGYKYKIVEKLNFVDAAFHDFNIALNFQKSIFEKVNVTIYGNTFLEKFKEIMKTKKPLATEFINIYVNSLEHAREIIHHADPKYLESIEIVWPTVFYIFESVKLKSSKKLQNFSHFSTASIQLEH